MRRLSVTPRQNWPAIVESQGMLYHSIDDVPYWDEGVCYEFTSREIDQLEAATLELNRICLKAVQHVLDENRLEQFLIPDAFHDYVRASWNDDDPTIYGRFDLCFDGRSPPKMLEFNADTPTGVIESAVIQWHWLKDLYPTRDQFNSLHEKLIGAWTWLRRNSDLGSQTLYFAGLEAELEDFMNVNYLRDSAIQAGWKTEFIDMSQIGWHDMRRRFLDLNDQPIDLCFKLYPWEWLQRESFGENILFTRTQWIEPAWKCLLSNKAILPILWELFPGHENLLEASFEPLASGEYVAKPIFSREGANIRWFRNHEEHFATDGPYDGPSVYQEVCELPNFDGFHPCLGSWIVGDEAAGMGIREDETLVTGNLSRFVPHYF